MPNRKKNADEQTDEQLRAANQTDADPNAANQTDADPNAGNDRPPADEAQTGFLPPPPTGDALQRAAAEEVRLRFNEQDEALRARGFRTQRPNRIWVQAAPGQMVPNGSGGFFSAEPFEVDVNDVYINRRIRDGSVLVVYGMGPGSPLVPANAPVRGAMAEEAPAENQPENPPQEGQENPPA